MRWNSSASREMTFIHISFRFRWNQKGSRVSVIIEKVRVINSREYVSNIKSGEALSNAAILNKYFALIEGKNAWKFHLRYRPRVITQTPEIASCKHARVLLCKQSCDCCKLNACVEKLATSITIRITLRARVCVCVLHIRRFVFLSPSLWSSLSWSHIKRIFASRCENSIRQSGFFEKS